MKTIPTREKILTNGKAYDMRLRSALIEAYQHEDGRWEVYFLLSGITKEMTDREFRSAYVESAPLLVEPSVEPESESVV